MTAYKMRRRQMLKLPSFLIAFFMVMTLSFAPKIIVAAPFDGGVTLEGYNVDTKDWTGDWTTGNLGKSYQEGESFPGRARIFNFQSKYPGFDKFPDLKIWYTSVYPIQGGADHGIFVDLVKGIQVGTRPLTDSEGWPRADGTAYPLGTPELVSIAQNHPGENAWNGYSLLNLPKEQINRSAITPNIGGLGSPYDGKRCFIVTAEDIKKALLAQGENPETVNDFYIYFELHLARTSVFANNLQTAYASGPPADWGGYIYEALDFNFVNNGAGKSSGSSGHFGMLEAKGSRDVQLPNVPETYRSVVGRKFLDANNNGKFDEGEVGLPNWTINLIGKIEDIEVPLTTKTDANGYYAFNQLSYGSELIIYEMLEENYFQTYPNSVLNLPIGAISFYEEVLGAGSWRWRIPSMLMPSSGDLVISGVDFGNFKPEPKIEVTKTGDMLSKIGDMIKFTVTVKNTGNVDLDLVSIVDDQFGPLDAVAVAGGFGAKLLKGAVESHEFEMKIPETAADPFVNKVTAKYSYMGKEATADAQHETNLFQPKYSIKKTVDKAGAVPGETVHYKITVQNNSSSDTPITHFVVTDEKLGWTGANVKVFSLKSGESKTFDDATTDYMIPLDAIRHSIVKNEASYVTSFDDFPNIYDGKASAETKVLMPILEITKSGDALSKIGDPVTYKFTVKNIGDVPLRLVEVYDETFKFDLTSLFTKAELAVGESDSATKEFIIPVGASDPFENKVKATYKYVMGDFEKSVTETSTFSINLFQPGIKIEKTADKSVSMIGDTVVYKIIVTNTSSIDAPNLIYTVEDDVYGQVVKDAELASGAFKEYIYSYKIKAEDKNPLVNTATVEASPVGFPNVLTDKDSHEIKLFTPNIKIEKSADTKISKVGDTIVYKIKVTNLTAESYAPDMDVTVTDDMLGLNQSFKLASGADKTITVNYVVKETDDPDYMTKYGWTELKNTAKLVASPVGFELLSKFELTASATVNLVHPRIKLEKSVNTNMAHVGDTLTYTVKITNTGDVELVNIAVKDSMMGNLTAFVKTLALGASDQHSYTRLLTVADIGMLENTASVLANPIGLPNKITDEDSETVEVRQKLYEETGWAFGGKYAIPINTLVTNANWGWTNGPLPEGSYKFPIYTGAGQNDITKGLKAGMLEIDYFDKVVTFRFKMDEGFSLKKVHLYAGKDELPLRRGVYTTSPGQFPFKPAVPDQATSFEYQVKLKTGGDIYIASHSEVYVPYWEMNSFYNTDKY